MSDSDFLDELIESRSVENREFPQLVEAALRKRELIRQLARVREELGLSQTWVAARMGTSQSSVARLERGDVDARMSTVSRYATALGKRIEWRVVDHGARKADRGADKART